MYKNKSLLGNSWEVFEFDERLILSSSQKNNISELLAKLLLVRNIKEDSIEDFLNPSIINSLPNPFSLKDMRKAINRVVFALKNNQKIGIIADYDVDGSTSASILFKFLNNFIKKIYIKIPKRLVEGYGPNIRIMDEMLNENIDLVFTLDCGTASKNIIDNKKYKKIDVIVIDHHLSEIILPKVHSIINPNRHDESSEFNDMAAVGVTFLFLMALRKTLREQDFFNKKNIEPNLMSYLDLVSLGTVCDVVKLVNLNRVFVKIGLDLIKQRKNKGITSIIDNSKLTSTPSSSDLGFIIGPQLNAASRIDDSSLPTKLLISNNISQIEIISKKLILLNEKRKLIENKIFEEALIQARNQLNQKFILVYGEDWHNGVLGIVASRLINEFHKPTIVISFINSIGTGSARSIATIDLGSIVLNAKNEKILLNGGGHKMAAGFKIDINSLKIFINFLKKNFEKIDHKKFKKIDKYDSIISSNEINTNLLESLDELEPFGSGNPEPRFVISDMEIIKIKILKNKHLLVFFKNNFSDNFQAICFNCIGKVLGDHLLEYKRYKLAIGCSIKRDHYNDNSKAQIIIKDAMIIN